MDSIENTILISAYACEPDVGSEPGVGWNWSIELSKTYKATVITRSNNREAIEKVYTKDKYPNLSFVYCDVPKGLTFWKRGQKGLHLYYLLWQIVAYRVAKKICKTAVPDYAMSLTFGNMWLPTFMHKLPCKFIWGPLGGGEGVPQIWVRTMSWKQQIIEWIRRGNKIFSFTNPWFYAACKKATLLIVRTQDSFACIPNKFKEKTMICIETGVNTKQIEFYSKNKEACDEKTTCDFVCSGKLVPFKQVSLAIEAFGKVCHEPSIGKLHIVGDGPEKRKLKKLVDKMSLNNVVEFHGKVGHEKAIEITQNCDVVLMPSAREGGSWVMYEAMLMKKPIVCFDTSGMSVVETKETAVLLPISPYQVAVNDFANAIQLLAQDSQLREDMGNEAFLRIQQEFLWEQLVSKFRERIS